MKLGVIDVGGGLRGIYAAGVFDYCLDHDITFDLGIGVSAGSANLASFIAKQPRRNYQFFTEYAMRKEYMGMSNFFSKGSFLNMDYIYGTLSNSNGESPLDYEMMMNNPMELYTVATQADTGNAKYFDKSDLAQDRYDIFKASCSIPFVNRPYTIDGLTYYDGALSDPVPLAKAFQIGCNKVVLILTLPVKTIRTAKKDSFLARRIQKEYPYSAEALRNRAKHYNHGVTLAKEYEKEGKVLIIAPDDTCGVSTLSRNQNALHQLYLKGLSDAEKIRRFL